MQTKSAQSTTLKNNNDNGKEQHVKKEETAQWLGALVALIAGYGLIPSIHT